MTIFTETIFPRSPQGGMYADATGPFGGSAMQPGSMLGAPQSNSLADDLLVRLAGRHGAGTQEGSGFWGITSADVRAAGADMFAAKEDRVSRRTPDEMVAQAFGDDLPQEGQAARTAQQVELHTNIGLAEVNAPDAIRETGTYSGPTPTPEQFVALYGVTEGVRRFQAFNRAIDVSRQFYGMRGMSSEAVRAMIRDAAPEKDSTDPEEDKAHHDAIVTAADLTFQARRGDPGGYVRKTFANLDAAWNNLSKLEDYQTAIIGSIAAQQQLGFETVQPLPNSVAEDINRKLGDESRPRQTKEADLSNVLQATPPGFREAMFDHLLRTSVANSNEGKVNDGFLASLVSPEKLAEANEFARRAVSGEGPRPEWLTNYVQTNQEWLGELIAGDSERGSLRRFLAQKLMGSDGLGEEGASLADFTPLGASFALEKAGDAALEGNYTEALFDAVGAIPAERLAGPVLKRAGAIAEPWVRKFSAFSKRSTELAGGKQILIRGVDPETLRFQQDLARSLSPRTPRRKGRSGLPLGGTSERAFDNAMLGAMLARNPSLVKYGGAGFGWEQSKNYRNIFFAHNPGLNPSDYVVHHAGERRILTRYPGLFSAEEINSIENLRGIRKEFDTNLHQKVLNGEWVDFYNTHPTATRQQIIDKISEIDKKYGHLFDPPIGD